VGGGRKKKKKRIRLVSRGAGEGGGGKKGDRGPSAGLDRRGKEDWGDERRTGKGRKREVSMEGGGRGSGDETGAGWGTTLSTGRRGESSCEAGMIIIHFDDA